MSAQRLRKFIQRAPRYVLRPQDNQVMRFSLESMKGSGESDETMLHNLSETGVAFIVKPETQIKVGDIIKVEIPVPSEGQIAWWAKVVRTESFEPNQWMFSSKNPFKEIEKVLVACRFEDMPDEHTLTIRRGIERSFIKAMQDQQYLNWHYYRALIFQNYSKWIFYAALTAASIWFLYYISQPNENYDSSRGAPWGQRFKFFNEN